MKIRRTSSVLVLALAGIVLSGCWGEKDEVPPGWKHLVKTKGQYYPIPAEWLSTEEARITHDLVLPDSIPKPVPFDFDAADGPWFWPKSDRDVARAYFRHLCKTEAGEWILETHKDVEGFYFARPVGQLTERYVSDLYKVEAPFVEYEFTWMGDRTSDRAGYFVNPPFRNYSYMEEPKRKTEWQSQIREKYVLLHAPPSHWEIDDGGRVKGYELAGKVEFEGIEYPSSKYAFTWRGITRPRDRELRIAGGELIIYERESKRVIAVSRTFQLGALTRGHPTIALWVQSPACREGIWPSDLFMAEFVLRTLREKPIVVSSQNKGTYLWQPPRSKSFMNFH